MNGFIWLVVLPVVFFLLFEKIVMALWPTPPKEEKVKNKRTKESALADFAEPFEKVPEDTEEPEEVKASPLEAWDGSIPADFNPADYRR